MLKMSTGVFLFLIVKHKERGKLKEPDNDQKEPELVLFEDSQPLQVTDIKLGNGSEQRTNSGH